MFVVHLIYEKIDKINSLIVQINDLPDDSQQSELIKNSLSPLINECCNFIRGKEKELLSTEDVVKALSKCNLTDPDKYKVIGTNFNNFDYLAKIIYSARQENDKAAFISEKIDKINSLIVQINDLPDDSQQSELIKNSLSPLINECCNFIRGKEKELLSTEDVVKALSKCNLTDPDKYKVIGTNFNNFDYLAKIIYSARQKNDKAAFISEKIDKINSLIVQINDLPDDSQQSELIKNSLSPLINECCNFIRGKEKELLSTEDVVKALSKCNLTDPDKYKVIGTNFNNFDYLAKIIYSARQENDKAAFISEKIDKINSLIVQINDLPDDSQQSELIKNSLSPLINECCNFIRGKEKEFLSIKNVLQVLSKCNLANLDTYKIVGTDFNNINYLAWIIKISMQSSSSKATFHLLDGVLYLLPNDLCIENVRERNILLVGENDFSFAYSYIVTHKDRSRNLIASEYQLLYQDLNAAVIYLLEQGVIIAYGMDATKLHECRHFGIGSFQRIQFNCPYDNRDGTTEGSIQKTYTKKLVEDFMASAKKLLHPNGKLHVSIQQPKNPESWRWGKKEYQNAWGLPSSACLHQFKLVKVIGNIQDRYSNKVHKSLQGEEPIATYAPYLGQGENLRINQFIFKHNGTLDILDYLEYTTDNETDSEDESNIHYRHTPNI